MSYTKEDFSLVMRTMDRIVSRPGFDIRSASKAEQTVVVVVSADGVIGNGGLGYFFEQPWDGDPTPDIFIDAYRSIGADACADALTTAFTERDPDRYDSLEDPFFEAFDDNMTRLAAFIRAMNLGT